MPLPTAKNDVNALTREPGALVESARALPARKLDSGDCPENRARGRHTPGWELEPDALTQVEIVEALGTRGRAHTVRARASGPADDNTGERALARVWNEDAALERAQSERAECEAGESEERASCSQLLPGAAPRHEQGDGNDREKGDDERTGTQGVRGGETEAKRRSEPVLEW